MASSNSRKQFEIGTRVITKDLKTTQYNGLVGTVIGHKGERVCVELEQGVKNFKPVNLSIHSKDVQDTFEKPTLQETLDILSTDCNATMLQDMVRVAKLSGGNDADIANKLTTFMEMMSSGNVKSEAGFKSPVSSVSEALSKTKDLHSWVEFNGVKLDDDNDRPEYKFARNMHNLTDERVYHGLNPEQSKKVWKKIFQKVVAPFLKKNKGISNEALLAHVKKKGLCCYIFSYLTMQKIMATAKKPVKNCRIVIGSMGWRAPDGRVWWEFG